MSVCVCLCLVAVLWFVLKIKMVDTAEAELSCPAEKQRVSLTQDMWQESTKMVAQGPMATATHYLPPGSQWRRFPRLLSTPRGGSHLWWSLLRSGESGESGIRLRLACMPSLRSHGHVGSLYFPPMSSHHTGDRPSCPRRMNASPFCHFVCFCRSW